MNTLKEFGDTAKGLAKNPLGIIALFIVLVYGFASLVTAMGSGLSAAERMPLIYFLVSFPVLVLGVFAWLVSQHSQKLYGPSDFRNEENYISIVASLAAASARRPSHESAVAEVNVRTIAESVRQVAQNPGAHSEAWMRRLLWVDDRPENNVFERKAFESLGLSIVLALSTQQALDYLQKDKVVAIISDMGRREGPREGYVLLDSIRKTDDRTPFFIYAGSNLPEHKQEAEKHGAQGSTNDPEELFRMVTSILPRYRRG